MRIVDIVWDHLSGQLDKKIIRCLRVHGLMMEPDLQRRTAIRETRLQVRLERLAERGLVRFDVNSNCWRIYHGVKPRAA